MGGLHDRRPVATHDRHHVSGSGAASTDDGELDVAQRAAHPRGRRRGADGTAAVVETDHRRRASARHVDRQPAGGGNRPHWHRDFDERWVVLDGVLEWELTGGTTLKAVKDDIVWVPRGTVHHIRNVGDRLSLRLAVAMPPAVHYASPCERCGDAADGSSEWCA